MDNFLPQGYTAPAGGSAYLKLEPGQTRLRILSAPLLGFVAWHNGPDGSRKPLRSAKAADLAGKGDEAPKHFWALAVLNAATKQVAVLEITQATVQRALEDLAKSTDWGAPYTYDVIISRQGTDKNSTKYTVTPCPKAALPAELIALVQRTHVNLGALLTGGDPMAQSPEATKLIAYDGLPF